VIDVGGSRELQANILALRQMDRTLRRSIYKATRENITPEWRQELYAESRGHLEERILAQPARANVTDSGVTLVTAQTSRKLSGGGSPLAIGHAAEFGATPHQAEITATRNGTTYTYKRRINTQFRRRKVGGHVAWPLAARLAARFAALWVQVTVRTTYEAFEGKGT
jgi:hypothetical protein